MQSKNQNQFLVAFNSSGTSYDNLPFHGSRLPAFTVSGGVAVEGISLEQHLKWIRKTTIPSEKLSFWSQKAGFETCASSCTKSVFSGAEARPTSSRQIKTFSGKLEKIDKQPCNFDISRGLSNPIFIRTKANKTSQSSWFNKEGSISSEPQEMLGKGVILIVEKSHNHF